MCTMTRRRLLWLPAAVIFASLGTLVPIARAQPGDDAVEAAASERAPIRVPSPKRDAGFLTDPERDVALWPPDRQIKWPILDTTDLALEDQGRDRLPKEPMRVGVNRRAPNGPINTGNAGTWGVLPDGSRIWTLQLVAREAKGIRVHFSEFELPLDARVTVSDGKSAARQAYRERGPIGDGSFWSVVIPGEVVYLEYHKPHAGLRDPVISIDEISHLYREGLPVEALGGPRGVGLPCHVDVNCFSPDLNARDSVGQMTFTIPGQGTFLCSGALVNDLDANTTAGYFLTANHCLSTQPAVNTLQIRWFNQTTGCGGGVQGGQVTTGGTLLATNTISDFTFLRTADDPELGQGLAAWTTAVVANTAVPVKGIHHPAGSWKRYAAGATNFTAPICDSTSFYIYLDWTTGIVEGGSSGSPLFNANWEHVGTLTGACVFAGVTPGCTNQSQYNTFYGRLSTHYTSVSPPNNQTVQFYLNTITPDDIYEDNDTLATAALIPIQLHALRLVDFDDFFRVSVCGPGTLTATATFSTTAMDLDMELLTPVGFFLDDSQGGGGTETVSTEAVTGDYIIRTIKDRRWGGDYNLNIVHDPIFDCDNNGKDDSCELAAGTAPDCNANGIVDACDLAGADCNNNLVPDSCDIARGTSGDCDLNGVPDSCESPICPASLDLMDMNCGGEPSSGPALARGSVYSMISSTAQRGGVGRLDSAVYTLRDGLWAAEAPCTVRPYADIVPAPFGDGNAEIGDVLCLLDGYNTYSVCPLGDIAPCLGDGIIELSDVLNMLDAYAGIPVCPDPCVDP